MKCFTKLAASTTLLAVAFAQRVLIGYPPDGSSVLSGHKFKVEIDRPNFQSSAEEVAIVIGLQSCASHPCHSPDNGIGTVLYKGGYNPQYDSNSKPPHQNFTVTVPSFIPLGKAQLGVVHVSLIGAGLLPFLETLNVTLNVV